MGDIHADRERDLRCVRCGKMHPRKQVLQEEFYGLVMAESARRGPRADIKEVLGEAGDRLQKKFHLDAHEVLEIAQAEADRLRASREEKARPHQVDNSRVEDQSELAEMALNAQDSAVRWSAVERLTAEGQLAWVAQAARDAAVRRAAVEKLTDPAYLFVVINKAEDFAMRQLALEKLADQEWLAHVVAEAQHRAIRRLAFQRITDQSALALTAIHAQDTDLREAAFNKLTDEGDRKVVVLSRLRRSTP